MTLMSKANTLFCSVPVVTFENLIKIKGEIKIFIASCYYYVIKEKLEMEGFTDILDVDYNPAGKFLGTFISCIKTFNRIRKLSRYDSEHKNEIKDIYNLLEDDKSKEVYFNIIKARLDWDFSDIYICGVATLLL